MSSAVAERKKPTSGSKKKYPSRDKVKYVPIPREWAEILKEVADDPDGHPGWFERSVTWFNRLALREFMVKHGLLPK